MAFGEIINFGTTTLTRRYGDILVGLTFNEETLGFTGSDGTVFNPPDEFIAQVHAIKGHHDLAEFLIENQHVRHDMLNRIDKHYSELYGPPSSDN